MSLISEVIDKIRVELFDENDARFSDANLLTLIKKSVERTNHVLMKNSVKFAKSSYDFDTISGTDTYALPSNYMALDSLYRIRTDDNTGWAIPLMLRNDDEWERMISATETTNWRVWGSNIEIFDEPASVVSLRFYYWPKIETGAWTTASTMPWGGNIDEVIAEYVTIRCKNIDEKDLNWDLQLLNDLVTGYLNTYGTSDPAATTATGFYPAEGRWGQIY
jgi:hypothetical protein